MTELTLNWAIERLHVARALPDVQAIVRQAARRAVDAEGVTPVLRDGEDCFYLDEDATAAAITRVGLSKAPFLRANRG